MSLSYGKADYIAKYGIGKTYFDETVQLLKSCDGFSIGLDESEINKNHECEVMVILSDKTVGIQLRHYKSISLDGTDADTIVKSLLGEMDDDQIPWREKLIAPMTDGCNTMAGCNKGVETQLAKLVPQLKDLGSCNDHHISNSAKHGCEAFDTDVKEVLVNLYFDIGGAKGKGLKKMRDFETISKKAKNKSITKKLIGATRFRSYRICIAPVISNWDSIVEYYDSVKKLTNRQSKLKPFFVDQEFASLLKLEFIMAATQDLNSAINFFEERRNKIHVVREKMEDILMCHLTKFVKSNFVKNIASNGDVSKKTGAELLEIDVTNSDLILGKKNLSL